jgi:hypothetical protein
MIYNLINEDSPAFQLISGKITKSEFMEIMVKRGRKEKRSFQGAERLLYDRGNRMPNLIPRKLVV